MNLSHLAIFYAVAEEGSISRGAERLHISQPAVSKQLAVFERALQTPLFDRLPKGIRITEAGAVLLEHARRLFAIEADAERALRELRGLERGRLFIGASTSIGAYLLPFVLARFHAAHPQVALDLQIGNTEAIQKALETGTLDIGFTEGFLHSEALEMRVFLEDELVPIAAPEYAESLLGRDEPLTLARLCEEPFVVREAGSGTREVVEAALQSRNCAPRIVMTLGNTEAIKKAVMAGVGVAIVSRITVQTEADAARLTILPVSDFTLHRPLHQLQMRGRHSSASVRAFLQTLRRSVATLANAEAADKP